MAVLLVLTQFYPSRNREVIWKDEWVEPYFVSLLWLGLVIVDCESERIGVGPKQSQAIKSLKLIRICFMWMVPRAALVVNSFKISNSLLIN